MRHCPGVKTLLNAVSRCFRNSLSFKSIGLFIIALPLAGAARAGAAPARVISLNAQQAGKEFHSQLNICIGGDHAANEMNPETMRQLAQAHRDCGIAYLRFHGLLDDDMKVVTRNPQGKLVYNWRKIDRLYAMMQKAGVKPLVELSFMPDALASGKATIFYYKGNTTPPKHFRQWGKLITALVRNLEKRFGRKNVETWYFEVWNEPNINFWKGTFQSYIKLYATTVHAIKAVDPKLRVGGPATAGLSWIKRFIAACHQKHLPVDFISSHTYGSGPHPWPGKRKGLRVAGNPNAIAGGIRATWAKIHHSAMPYLPLFISEWGPSYSSRDAVHDSYFQGVWLLEQLHSMKHPPQIMSYWALSDIFEEDGPQTLPFEGGFGIFNPEGIRKPTFFALEYLHDLQGRQLMTHDGDSIAVVRHGGISLLAWSYHWPKQTARDDVFFAAPHPSVPARTISLHVKHLKAGKYILRIHEVGYRHNDAYTIYQKWGRPPHLTGSQLGILRRSTTNKPVIKKIVTVAGSGDWTYQVPMRTNQIILLQLSPTVN